MFTNVFNSTGIGAFRKVLLQDLSHKYFRISNRYLFHNIAPESQFLKIRKVACVFRFQSIFYLEIVDSCFEWKLIVTDGEFFFDKQLLTKFINFMV